MSSKNTKIWKRKREKHNQLKRNDLRFTRLENTFGETSVSLESEKSLRKKERKSLWIVKHIQIKETNNKVTLLSVV